MSDKLLTAIEARKTTENSRASATDLSELGVAVFNDVARDLTKRAIEGKTAMVFDIPGEVSVSDRRTIERLLIQTGYKLSLTADMDTWIIYWGIAGDG